MPYTLDEIRAEFLCEITDEVRESLTKMFRDKCTYNEAADLFCAAIQNIENAAEANKDDAAAFDEMNMLDKILLLIREAYVVGAITAFEIAAQTNAAGIISLESKRGEQE